MELQIVREDLTKTVMLKSETYRNVLVQLEVPLLGLTNGLTWSHENMQVMEYVIP